ETVGLALTNPTGGATLGTPNTATLTINENDPQPSEERRVGKATKNGGENVPGGTMKVTVKSGGRSAGGVGATFATSNGSATAPADYTAIAGASVNFAAGDTSDKTVTITIIDDTTYEGDETVGLTLTNPTGGATLGTPNTATLTINENDPV